MVVVIKGSVVAVVVGAVAKVAVVEVVKVVVVVVILPFERRYVKRLVTIFCSSSTSSVTSSVIVLSESYSLEEQLSVVDNSEILLVKSIVDSVSSS